MHEAEISFVRQEMLAEREPPLTESGAIKWLRENLFSGWLNSILTVAAIYFIWLVLSAVVPWIFGGVWNAGSLNECREILHGQEAEGERACWAVIRDRWDQLTFGFYPQELYWRPVIAFVIFLVAILPILFDRAPRQLFYLTAIAPFLCFWLLWGGSIWSPIAVAFGFVIGWAVAKYASPMVGDLAAMLGSLIVPILYWLLLAGPLAGALHSIIPIGIEAVGSKDFGGFLLAIVIGLTAIIISLPMGILLALARQSDLFIIKTSAVVFIEVIRGVPLIVWLFTASLLLNYFMPPGTNFDLVLRVIIMVTFFSAAYIAEVIRGGLAALPRGQYEGADSLGLNYWQSMRLIILPQALKISIPGIVNTFIGLFKDTTLVLFIGLFDPIGFSNAIRASTEWNGIYWELFIFIGVVFWIFCFAMSQYSQWLERKLHTGR